MQDDKNFLFDASTSSKTKRERMKEFLIQKGDALLVLVKIRADFAIPTLSDIKAARLDSAKGTTMQPTTTRRRDPGVDTIAIEHISDDFIVPIEMTTATNKQTTSSS